MKRKIILLELILLLLAGGFFAFKIFSKQEEIHYHAGFRVFVDGQLQDFSDMKYMKIEPCGVEEHQEDEQLEKAHLHEKDGDVVHVHRNNAKWKDLFTNIRYQIDTNKPIKGFINGQEVSDILNQKIKPYDNLVLVIGDVSDQSVDYLNSAVKRERIVEVEGKSETCGS